MEKVPDTKVSAAELELKHTIENSQPFSPTMIALRDFIRIERAERNRERCLDNLSEEDLTEGERGEAESVLRMAELRLVLADDSKDRHLDTIGYSDSFDYISEKAATFQKEFEQEEKSPDDARYIVVEILERYRKARLKAATLKTI